MIKLSVKTEHALLALIQLEPLYVSLNSREGRKDCAKVFNEHYENFEEESHEPKAEKVKTSPRVTQPRRKSTFVPSKSVEIVTTVENVTGDDMDEP